jgi:ubiquinone/menaquinone biosynthesis C-methylase UbiE
MDQRGHWEHVYRTKRADEVSWFQQKPTMSLDFIRRINVDEATPFIDIGGGASSLVDNLVDNGYSDITVLDLSGTALAETQERLGGRAREVQWLEADVLRATLPERRFRFWHDRAVFHFLTDLADRAAYVAQVRRAVRPGGYVLVSIFAEDGPSKCSGLPVARYSAESLHREFDGGFRLVESAREQHVTPAGVRQSFTYCLCRYGADSSSLAA